MRLPHSLSPYLVLRLRLAHHALLQFAANLASSMEILVFLAGPVLLGLLTGVIALPRLSCRRPALACRLGSAGRAS